MSKGTRSNSDKNEIEELYKQAVDGKKSRSKPPTSNSFHASTPTIPTTSTPRQIDFSLDESSIENTLVYTAETPEPDSDSSDDITIQQFKTPINNIVETIESDSEGFETMAQNPFATLKYAVEAVPYFDGNNISLNYFIEGCEEAKSMLPKEAEQQFTKIIRTRIVGEARRTIQDQEFDKVSQLTSYLKKVYGPSKNVYQLQGELGCIYQKPEEDVITYANRVKVLGKQILEAYRSSGHTAPDQNIKTSLERDMCKCFFRGLKPDIEQRIEKELDVNETVADALRIERELRAMTDLRQGLSANLGQNQPRPANRSKEICQICYKEGHMASNCRKLTQSYSQGQNQTTLGTEILICQICKKRGHSADKCRLRDPRSRQSVNVIQEKTITCQLCSKIGHNAKTCRQSNISQQPHKTIVTCQWCDKPGHSANNCWKKQNEQRNSVNNFKIACQICNNFGHIAKDCRSKNQTPTSTNNLYCRYCKEQGHLLDNCQLRIASNNRRKGNEQGNENGPSTSGVQKGPERTSHPSAQREVK
ncbi:hypothetical protein RF55_20394 [Lasius niger]|uniref:CCHC-type domain-containing protein n=1 Tax=Lasius niger TaxID=67767 RepID=A0A0J7JYM9_LASNI|nr:hypothetical protein RF55_20394 [Lasius niger]